jgi:hypothetical protein
LAVSVLPRCVVELFSCRCVSKWPFLGLIKVEGGNAWMCKYWYLRATVLHAMSFFPLGSSILISLTRAFTFSRRVFLDTVSTQWALLYWNLML